MSTPQTVGVQKDANNIPYGQWWDSTANSGNGGWRDTSDLFPLPTSGPGVFTPLVAINLAAGGTYSAGDYVGPSGGLGVAVNPANRGTGQGGVLQSLTLYDQDNQGVPMDIYVFANNNWTSPSDNAAWSITDGSAQYMVGMCSINTYVANGSGQVGFATFPYGAIPYQCNGQTLYLAMVTRNTPTYTATKTTTAGLQIRPGLLY
jgi:hypothetical protein